MDKFSTSQVEKVFWAEPYLRVLTAKVTSVMDNQITLDKTIAFAFSGGQASDSGSINDYPILKAEKVGKEIIYLIPANHDLNPGEEVLIKIDWEKRYRIMKLHFAAELILELVYQNYDRPMKIGANITDTKARVDFAWSGNISQTFALLERKAAAIIESDLPITSAFSNVDQEERYWEIAGFGKVSCGGTHLRSTGEIGPIKLKRDNLGKNKERIEITLID